MLAAASDGFLYRFSPTGWAREAQVCADVGAYTSNVRGFHVSAGGNRAWFTCDPGGPPGHPTHTYVYELQSKTLREIPLDTGEFDLGPLSPDGRYGVATVPGECPMPAPVCQTRRMLVDLSAGTQTELLPSGYWWIEMRWFDDALTYFRSKCAPAGCVSDAEAGSYRWDGSTWTKFSDHRAIDILDDRMLLEQRDDNITQFNEPSRVFELVSGAERELTHTAPSIPSYEGPEFGVALVPDGAVTFRVDSSTGHDGLFVRYRDGHEIGYRIGDFAPNMWVEADGWIVSVKVSPNGSTMHAYSLRTQETASRALDIPLVALAALPPRY